MGDGQSHGYTESQCRKGNHAYGPKGLACMRCGHTKPKTTGTQEPASSDVQEDRSLAVKMLAEYLDKDLLLSLGKALEQVIRTKENVTVRIGYDDGKEGSGIGIDDRGVFAYEKHDGMEYVTYVQPIAED